MVRLACVLERDMLYSDGCGHLLQQGALSPSDEADYVLSVRRRNPELQPVQFVRDLPVWPAGTVCYDCALPIPSDRPSYGKSDIGLVRSKMEEPLDLGDRDQLLLPAFPLLHDKPEHLSSH